MKEIEHRPQKPISQDRRFILFYPLTLIIGIVDSIVFYDSISPFIIFQRVVTGIAVWFLLILVDKALVKWQQREKPVREKEVE